MNDNTKDGGSAFPLPQGSDTTAGSEGMTLRDYFAGQALQANIIRLMDETFFVSFDKIQKRDNTNPSLLLAKLAYESADAMLIARQP